METLLTFASCILMAYTIARVEGPGHFHRADLVLGVFAGAASSGLARALSAEGAAWDVGLAIFFGCALTLGLASLRRRSLWH